MKHSKAAPGQLVPRQTAAFVAVVAVVLVVVLASDVAGARPTKEEPAQEQKPEAPAVGGSKRSASTPEELLQPENEEEWQNILAQLAVKSLSEELIEGLQELVVVERQQQAETRARSAKGGGGVSNRGIMSTIGGIIGGPLSGAVTSIAESAVSALAGLITGGGGDSKTTPAPPQPQANNAASQIKAAPAPINTAGRRKLEGSFIVYDWAPA